MYSKKLISPKENSVFWSAVCGIFPKFSIKLASVYRIPYGSLKLRKNQQNQLTISVLFIINLSLKIQVDKLVYRSDLEKKNLASFPSNGLNYRVIIFYLQNLSNINIAKFTTSSRTDIKLQKSVKSLNHWAQLRCVGHSP